MPGPSRVKGRLLRLTPRLSRCPGHAEDGDVVGQRSAVRHRHAGQDTVENTLVQPGSRLLLQMGEQPLRAVAIPRGITGMALDKPVRIEQ